MGVIFGVAKKDTAGGGVHSGKRCENPEKLKSNHIGFLWVWIYPNLLHQLKFRSKYKHIQTYVENIFYSEFVIYFSQVC